MEKRKPTEVITKIRTGAGDEGHTVIGNTSYRKDERIVEFLGDLDEAVSSLGVCHIQFDNSSVSCNEIGIQKKINDLFEESKRILFIIGAMTHSETARAKHTNILSEYTTEITELMDEIINNDNYIMEPLEGFIIPSEENGDLMLARAIIRRAERSAVRASATWSYSTLNAMSDFVFFIIWYSSLYLEQWKGFN